MPNFGARAMVKAPGYGQTPNKLPPGSAFGLPQPQGGLYGLNNKPGLTPGFGLAPQPQGGLQAGIEPQAPAMQPAPRPFDSPTGQRPPSPDPYAGMTGSDIFARLFQR